MSYDENFMPTLEEFAREATAAHQMELDALNLHGNKYGVSTADMAVLCQLANISLSELMNYSGVSA